MQAVEEAFAGFRPGPQFPMGRLLADKGSACEWNALACPQSPAKPLQGRISPSIGEVVGAATYDFRLLQDLRHQIPI